LAGATLSRSAEALKASGGDPPAEIRQVSEKQIIGCASVERLYLAGSTPATSTEGNASLNSARRMAD